MNMDKNFNEIAKTLIDKIAKTAGLTNDISLLEGKMGIVILLFLSSRYFSSKDHEKVAEFLIDDIVDEKTKLSQMAHNRSSEIFWALNYLSDTDFIELEADFFSEIDELLIGKIDDLSKISAVNYPFLGNYILSRYNSSACPDYWISQIQTYLQNMLRIIISNKGLYRRNTNLLAPFWYTMIMCKEKEFNFEFENDDFGEVSLFFVEVCSVLPDNEKRDAWFQFYSLYNNLEFKYNSSDVRTISDINIVYLNKLLYPDFMMPPDSQMLEVINEIANDEKKLQELGSLLSYQNVGISSYVSGLAWSLLYFLNERVV